jgi:hypothetical protein
MVGAAGIGKVQHGQLAGRGLYGRGTPTGMINNARWHNQLSLLVALLGVIR